MVPPEGAEPLESSEEQFERIMKQISACSQRALLKHQAGMGENREVFGIQQLEMEIAAVVWGGQRLQQQRGKEPQAVRGCRQQLEAHAAPEEGPEEGLEGRLSLREAGVRKQLSSGL